MGDKDSGNQTVRASYQLNSHVSRGLGNMVRILVIL